MTNSHYLRHGLLFALAAATQIALLGWMIGDRALILARGTEFELEVEPVDPRDPLRGEYVQLRYAISEIDRSKLPVEATRGWPTPPKGYSPIPVWIVLGRANDGKVEVLAIHDERPKSEPGMVVLAAKARCRTWNVGTSTEPCTRLSLDFGIERFYVPEGAGKAIEDARLVRRVSVVAAIGSDGRAAIKRLLIDGKPVHDEPML